MLKINDVVTMERKNKFNGTIQMRRNKVRITSVEGREGQVGVYCTYQPVDQEDDNRGWFGWGCTWFGRAGQWDAQIVARHGNQPPRPLAPLPNLKGNPGYDLMM